MKIPLTITFLTTWAPFTAYAAIDCLPNNPFCNTPSGLQNIRNLIFLLGDIRNWIAAIFVILATILFLWAAFLFITAGDDSTRVTKARKFLIWALIGVVIALFAYGILTFVNSLLGGSGGSSGCPSGQTPSPVSGNCIPVGQLGI